LHKSLVVLCIQYVAFRIEKSIQYVAFSIQYVVFSFSLLVVTHLFIVGCEG